MNLNLDFGFFNWALIQSFILKGLLFSFQLTFGTLGKCNILELLKVRNVSTTSKSDICLVSNDTS